MPATIDDRGRVLIPKELRDELGLGSGQQVRFELQDDGTLRVHPIRTARQVLDKILGSISEENADPDAEPLDPLDVKRIWEPRLPGR